MTSESGVYLFHLRSHNDVDHATPIILSFLKSGHNVRVLVERGYRFAQDYRLSAIRSYPNLELVRASSVDSLRRFLFFGKGMRRVFPWWSEFWLSFLNQRPPHLRNVVCAIYDWGGVSRLNFVEAGLLGIYRVAIPHGYNCYLNLDVTESLVERIANERKPDFSERNSFDLYLVNNKQEFTMLTSWGMSERVLRICGSPRFSEDWVEENLQIIDNQIRPPVPFGKKLILFFLPHWTYRVKREDAIDALKSLVEVRNLHVIIRAHTRHSSGNLTSEELADLESVSTNFTYDTSTPSSLLIDLCDVVVGFGTSMSIEALVVGKPLLHLPFLHENYTIFDYGSPAIVCEDKEALLESVSNFLDSSVGGRENQSQDQEWFNLNIYAGRSPHSVAQNYVDEITQLVGQGRRKH